MTKEKIKEISNKLIEFARYIEQRAELNENVADYKYQYYYEQLLEIRDDLSEMQDAWWSAKSN
jgi:chorismate mutase